MTPLGSSSCHEQPRGLANSLLAVTEVTFASSTGWAGLTKSPVEAGDQGACPSADPSSFVPSQDGPRSSAPFAGPHLDVEAALTGWAAVEVKRAIRGCVVVGPALNPTIVQPLPSLP
jgi:hypothetical protein